MRGNCVDNSLCLRAFVDRIEYKGDFVLPLLPPSLFHIQRLSVAKVLYTHTVLASTPAVLKLWRTKSYCMLRLRTQSHRSSSIASSHTASLCSGGPPYPHSPLEYPGGYELAAIQVLRDHSGSGLAEDNFRHKETLYQRRRNHSS